MSDIECSEVTKDNCRIFYTMVSFDVNDFNLNAWNWESSVIKCILAKYAADQGCIQLVGWRATREILICSFAVRRSPVDLYYLLLK